MIDMEREDLCLDLVHGARNRSGQLPGTTALAFIPKERAERAMALDQRIEKLRKVSPILCAAGASILVICLTAAEWMAPGLAALTIIACILQAMGKYRRGC